MSFDEDPRDEEISFPCPDCCGVVTLNQDGIWECQECTFTRATEGKKR